MRFLDDVRAGLSPAGERLFERFDQGYREPLPRREMAVPVPAAG
jgi:hypothetical protein